MKRIIFIAVFLLGAAVIMWMGAGFISVNPLALTVIAVIACVYMIGFTELIQFRAATATLQRFLIIIQAKALISKPELDDQLAGVHPSLSSSVRLRIEGERIPLPAPVLTPYLVGLLVMLGLLGTFAGMVDTLKGAVIALEGTTELQAVRAGLAAPIKGLGLAFGTSVAGVAASAMLGLLSTLSRRDRMLATRQLDSCISTSLQTFSLAFNRNETYRVLQSQAQAFPEVVDKLASLTLSIEKMGGELSAKLASEQEKFHDAVKQNYTALAGSVGDALTTSLSESGRITSEAILPILKDGINTITQHISHSVTDTHKNLKHTTDVQLEEISKHILQGSQSMSASMAEVLKEQKQTNQELSRHISDANTEFNGTFIHNTALIVKSLDESSQSLLKALTAENERQHTIWQASFENNQTQVNIKLTETTAMFLSEYHKINEFQKQNTDSYAKHLEQVSSKLMENWSVSTGASTALHEQFTDSLKLAMTEMVENTKITSTTLLSDLSHIFKRSEELVAKRIVSESDWLNSYETRVDALTSMIGDELKLVVKAEQERDKNTTLHLAKLEETVSSQLALLGNELEAPMTRLIETASETPRAAAEVISRLSHEISNNIERDNALLEERANTIESLEALFQTLQKNSAGQSDAVEALVNSSSTMLKDVSLHFTQKLESEIDKLTSITDNFSGSTVDMASLGDAFSHSVTLFNQSTGSLIEKLSRIEESLNSSTTKSDEQMAYYIAQAREIIDYSVTSQQVIIDQLSSQTGKQKINLANTEAV